MSAVSTTTVLLGKDRAMASSHSTVTHRQINNFPDYRVGDDGSIWSRKVPGTNIKRRIGDWRRLKGGKSNGYLTVTLFNMETKRTTGIHVLVLETFVGLCPFGMECCHNDGNGRNNNLSNLRWDTHKNNVTDMVIHETKSQGERHGNAKLTEAKVRKIKRLTKAGWKQAAIARLLQVSNQTVADVQHRKTWRHVTL